MPQDCIKSESIIKIGEETNQSQNDIDRDMNTTIEEVSQHHQIIFQRDTVSMKDKDGKMRYVQVLSSDFDDEDGAVGQLDPAFHLLQGEKMNKLDEIVLQVFDEDDKANRVKTISANDVTLVNRLFSPGAIVISAKDSLRLASQGIRDASKIVLGTVIDVQSHIQLKHSLSEQEVEGWFDIKDLQDAEIHSKGDFVIHNDWIGVVKEKLALAFVETESGSIEKLYGSNDFVKVGPTSRNIFGVLSGTALAEWKFLNPPKSKRVCDVKLIIVAVNWMSTNHRNSSSITEAPDTPQKFWLGNEIHQLALVHGPSIAFRALINGRVIFRDQTRNPLASSSTDSSPSEAQRSKVFTITQVKTSCTVLWQNGTKTVESSVDLHNGVGFLSETFLSPSDVGMFSGVSPPKAAVIQGIDPKKRTVQLKMIEEGSNGHDKNKNEAFLASLLEFSPFGSYSRPYGLFQSARVMIAAEDATTGVKIPLVARLGGDVYDDENFPTRRTLLEEMLRLSETLMEEMSEDHVGVTPKASIDDLRDINWFGIAVDFLLDGRVVVQFPSGEKESFPLNRLYLLMQPDFAPDSDDEDSDEESGSDSENATEERDEDSKGSNDGAREPKIDRTKKAKVSKNMTWSDDDDDHETVASDWSTTSNDSVSETIDETPPMDMAVDGEEDEEMQIANDANAIDSESDLSSSLSINPSDPTEEAEEKWSRFFVLESAPEHHHFFKEKVENLSKQFMARVQKEQRVLSSSLPENIVVRAYEDRSDLLRCLIIGPKGTPFQDAPFLFDIHLSPTNFPTRPPRIFFHSWVSGERQISPNLQNEGGVCLSLINSWGGQSTEGWSSDKSSILQLLISIQSLIMVDKPYFTQAGLEAKKSTLEGKKASDDYNETTFILTRVFIKHALEFPPTDFEEEIKLYYLDGLKEGQTGALSPIIEQCQELLKESEDHKDCSEVEGSKVIEGLSVVPAGDALALKRTLRRLEKFLK